jgi:Flp pilus assembly protein TadD
LRTNTVTKTPTNDQAWLSFMEAGKRNFQQGKHRDAAVAFSRAIQLFPDRVEAWINLGSALVEARRYNDAIIALEKAITFNPKLMVSHLLLGDALRMSGQWQQALANYQQAVALERSPISLNKLACAARANDRPEFAEGLYREALDMAPDFTLAQVNLATLQMELARFDEADKQLQALEALSLIPVEQHEVKLAQLCLSEYRRLQAPIAALADRDDPAPLEAALRDHPAHMTQCDETLLAKLQHYADASQRVSVDKSAPLQEVHDEWPLIEAMFMIPLANSVTDYRNLKEQVEKQTTLERELQVSANMQAPIRAAQSCRADMEDPIKAELHLRHWHAMSCKELDGVFPGHFKYTRNWIPANPAIKRVEPALASPTLRRFISDIYCTVAPGYARAAVVLLAIVDLHLFADGNGRVAFTWLNRELEWAGLMPALFPDHLGYQGELGKALNTVQSDGSDLYPIIDVICKAQEVGLSFCAELATA